MNLTVCLPCHPVQFPVVAGCFKGFFLADHTLPTRPESAWQKMAHLLSMTPHNVDNVDSEEEGRSSTKDRQWLK